MAKILIVFAILAMAAALCSLAGGDPLVPAGPLTQDTPRPQNNTVGLILAAIQAEDSARQANATLQVVGAIGTATAAAEMTQGAVVAQQYTLAANQQAGQATAQAAATGTVQAITVLEWTATADANISTSTAQAQATATSQALYITNLTVTADVAKSTEVARKQATLDAFDAQVLADATARRQLTNTLEAVRPYLILFFCLLMLTIGVWQLLPVLASRLRDRYPDTAGRYPVTADNHDNYYLVDRNPLPTGGPGKPITVPQMAAEWVRIFSDTTARAQAVDLATRGYPGQQARPAAQAPRELPPLPAGVNSHLYGPAEMPRELAARPDVLEALEGQWREDDRA